MQCSFLILSLFFCDSIHRTLCCASSAFNTCFWVNLEMICSLRNSFYRTLVCASSTTYTFISNYICHGMYLLFAFTRSHILDLFTYFNINRGNIQEVNCFRLGTCFKYSKSSSNSNGGVNPRLPVDQDLSVSPLISRTTVQHKKSFLEASFQKLFVCDCSQIISLKIVVLYELL